MAVLDDKFLEDLASLLEEEEKKTEEKEEDEPKTDVYMNITSISRIGQILIDIENQVQVPSNYTDLPPHIFDVWYKRNSHDEQAIFQNFTYNLTSFTSRQIEIDLFFSDPLYVSSDRHFFDEVVVRL